MWFMSYLQQNHQARSTATCNCVVKIHPVLQIQEWNKQQKEQGYVYALLFYDKLPDDVAAAARDLDLGIYEYGQ